MNDIGQPIPTYNLYLRRNGKHGAVINWQDAAGVPSVNLNGTTLRLIVGERDNPIREFTAVVVDAVSTFHFSAGDTDLPFDLYDGLIMVDDNGDLTPLVDLKIHVGPS